jgi:pSer/pThr/pTyr-binding forkhead associated (FHA) protein
VDKDSTQIGSSPKADIYLFKDAEIAPSQAIVHRIGSHYEVEDLGSEFPTTVNQQPVQRRRLVSGDQVCVGATILEFEERSKRSLTTKTLTSKTNASH